MPENDFYVDMHIHTNYSDGVFTPSEVVEYATKLKLAAISITDHDSVEGIDEAIEAASKTALEVVPGIELSSEVGDNQKSEMHILGYHIDYKSPQLTEALGLFKEARQERAEKILGKLEKHGLTFKDKTFMESSGKRIIGRLHFAKAMIEEGHVHSISEAFQRYLAPNKPAYVQKYALSAAEAIKLVKRAGGVPVMAHPYYNHYSDRALMQSLVNDGLMGLEAWHIKHPDNLVRKISNMAQEYDLIVTGGSDCHGPYKKDPPIMGKVKVPYSVVENLEAARNAVRASL